MSGSFGSAMGILALSLLFMFLCGVAAVALGPERTGIAIGVVVVIVIVITVVALTKDNPGCGAVIIVFVILFVIGYFVKNPPHYAPVAPVTAPAEIVAITVTPTAAPVPTVQQGDIPFTGRQVIFLESDGSVKLVPAVNMHGYGNGIYGFTDIYGRLIAVLVDKCGMVTQSDGKLPNIVHVHSSVLQDKPTIEVRSPIFTPVSLVHFGLPGILVVNVCTN